MGAGAYSQWLKKDLIRKKSKEYSNSDLKNLKLSKLAVVTNVIEYVHVAINTCMRYIKETEMKHVRFAFALIIVAATMTIGYSQSVRSPQTTDSTKVTSVKVKGVTCSMDLKLISTNVEKLKGVSTCRVTKEGARTVFEITYSPSVITDKEIYAAIEGTGSCEDPDERPYKVKR